MAIRTAIFKLVNVNSVGKIVKKTESIASVANSSSEHKIYEYSNGSAPNAANNDSATAPNIHEYLTLEGNDGYSLVHMDQFFIITSSP